MNLSGRQLEDPYLVEKIKRVLASTGFPGPPARAGDHRERRRRDRRRPPRACSSSSKRSASGFAIDDFGTGYSSLNYLRALPVDVLKIDRAFAQTLDGETDTVLLEAIVRLGHSLGIDMIAEGIEHEEQAATLRAPRLPPGPGLPVPPAAVGQRDPAAAVATGPCATPAVTRRDSSAHAR